MFKNRPWTSNCTTNEANAGKTHNTFYFVITVWMSYLFGIWKRI